VENDKDDKRTVHVANLSIAMNQDALVQLMSHVGTVVATKMGGEGKTYAFVEFLSHEQARTAKGLNGMEIGGRSLKVEFSKQSRLIGTTTNVVIHYGPQQQLALEQEQKKKEKEREEKERARNQMREERDRVREERERVREERERARAQEILAAEKSKPIYSNPNVRHQIEMQKVLEGKTEEEILLERARAQKRMKPDQPGKLMTAAERAAKRAQEISARLNAKR
jgi:RNA recognition motif-containing protein